MAYDFSWTCSIKPSKRELKVHEGPENKKIGISPISRRTVFGRQSKRTPQSLEYRLNRTNFAHSNPDKMKKRPPFRRGECGIFRLIFPNRPSEKPVDRDISVKLRPPKVPKALTSFLSKSARITRFAEAIACSY